MWEAVRPIVLKISVECKNPRCRPQAKTFQEKGGPKQVRTRGLPANLPRASGHWVKPADKDGRVSTVKVKGEGMKYPAWKTGGQRSQLFTLGVRGGHGTKQRNGAARGETQSFFPPLLFFRVYAPNAVP